MEVLKNAKIKTELEITGVTLLSAEEAEALPQPLRAYKKWWWLRSPSDYQGRATRVDYRGLVCYCARPVDDDSGTVRPALMVSNLEYSDLEIGDRFEFGGADFKIISDNLAFCTGDIGRRAFRDDWTAEDANVYEASDVKQFVDEWFNNALKLS